jgi:hypothetical protein
MSTVSLEKSTVRVGLPRLEGLLYEVNPELVSINQFSGITG